MKRTLLIALGAVAVSVTAQDKTVDDAALKKAILHIAGYDSTIHQDEQGQVVSPPPPTVQDIAEHDGISRERMTRVLGELICERLADFEKADSNKKYYPRRDVCFMLYAIPWFHGPDTPAVLRECAKVADERISSTAVAVYVEILEGGGDSAAFLRETVGGGNMDAGTRSSTYFQLTFRGIIPKLKENKKDEDLEKLHAFMLDMIRVEQDASNAGRLDTILCATLDGYAQSKQRQQLAQRFANTGNDWTRNHYGALKAEMDKIPVEKRTDLSTRFPPAPLPMEK